MDQVRDAIVFQSGTTLADQLLISNGGRVLTITALGQDLSDARSKALQAVDTISFEGKYFRRDIGYEFF
jgi:phosphoribosylamine--glycine ligase